MPLFNCQTPDFSTDMVYYTTMERKKIVRSFFCLRMERVMKAEALTELLESGEMTTDEICPVLYTMSILGQRWKLPILWHLADEGTLRYNELKRGIPLITNIMLTQSLRELERSYTEDTNLPSQQLCERLGMRREGLFMEFVSFINNPDGTPLYENTMQYAILKKEWEAQ